MKSSLRLSRASLVAPLALALLAVASPARAEDPLPCEFPDDPAYRCFKSDSVTLSKSSSTIPFENGLRTGWLNCEAPQGDKTPCAQQPNFKCNTLGACLEVAMDDSKLDISMQHTWDVYWPEIGKLKLFPRKPIKEGGSFAFTYKLKPTFSIMIDALNNKWFFSVDPTDIIDLLDKSGTVKDFQSSASGSCKFAPFAFDPPVACPGNSMNGTVFSFPLSDLGININEYINISLGLDAGTSDVVFSWQTDNITVNGGDKPIDKTNPSTNIPYSGGGEVQATVKTTGKLTYKGKTFLAPTIEVTEIAGLPLKFKWPVDVGADLPFEGTIPIKLNDTNFKISLPDLTLITTTLDFGEVVVGDQKTKPVKMTNFGDMILVGDVSSSGPDFKAVKSLIKLDPTKEESFDIAFLPKKLGKIEATIFIKTNDPDQPEQTIKVAGIGKAPDEPIEPEPTAGSGGSGGSGGKAGAAGKGGKAGSSSSLAPGNTDESAGDGGCGCRAAGSPASQGHAALAALALVGAVARRRRRLQHARTQAAGLSGSVLQRPPGARRGRPARGRQVSSGGSPPGDRMVSSRSRSDST